MDCKSNIVLDRVIRERLREMDEDRFRAALKRTETVTLSVCYPGSRKGLDWGLVFGLVFIPIVRFACLRLRSLHSLTQTLVFDGR